VTIDANGTAHVLLRDNSSGTVSWHTDPLCSARLAGTGAAAAGVLFGGPFD
jgi:hypothetical protein